MKNVVLLFACCCSFLAVGQTNHVLFVGSSFPLILEEDTNGNKVGVAVDIIHRIMDDSGLSYSIIIVPWSRAQIMMQQGEADILIGPYKSQEREAFLEYSTQEIYKDQMVLYAAEGDEFNWQGDFSTLKDKVIGVPLGWVGGALFEENRARLTIYDVPFLSNGLNMLARKRIDLVLANNRNVLFSIKQLNLEQKVHVLSPPLQEIKGYFGYAKK